jgi:hypothetical protein
MNEKRKNSSGDSSSYNKKQKMSEKDCSELDEKFKDDTEASLLKARELKQCRFDTKDTECIRKNPEHFEEFSHKYHCHMGDINNFKEDTDTFLENTYNIYNCNDNFSTAWNTKVGADRGEEGKQLKTFIFNRYNTFIFYMLANIALHLEEYETKYGSDFLQSMLFAFETNDNTGLFPVIQFDPIRKVFTRYAPIERESGKIDYRLSNTTLRGIIENRSKKGGKKTKKRSTKKRSTKKQTKKRNKKTRKHYIKRK